jgi:hypothetical protein
MNRWKKIFRGVVTAGLLAVVTASYGSFDRPVKVTHKENDEIKYYDTKFAEGCRKIYYNLRDGSLGLMRNACDFVSGTAAGVGIWTGKFLVLSGDVVGFADDNLLTRHITRGILSDAIERASYMNFRMVKTIMLTSHEMDDLPIVIDREEYIDDNVIFKSRLYLRPWGVIVVPATLVGDGVIRPAASIAEFFSMRRFTDMEVEDIPTQLDEYGLQMIFNAYHMKLFFPIPDEEEPDLRIYTEEEVVGIRPPGPMLRPME